MHRECDCHHARPAATWGGDTCYARGGSQPQSRRHSPTARSSQRHVPSATTARASQERKAGQRGKGQGKGQQTGIRKKKNQGSNKSVQRGYTMEAE